ncbi:MAG: DNA starvation/stationary phase protection protein [Streptococcaceae bacterium]|jgi:starvation-inducible DNA-binding protein|nr:DNA starvation/stationary phase protection protein [Streptococcaceae bacterium]
MKYAKTKEVLNQAVADLSTLSALIHQIHWYLRGPGFLKLHPKMDVYMDDVNEQLDEISERLITLDGTPVSTLREFADKSKIEMSVADWSTSTEVRFKELIKAMRYMTELYQEGLDASDEEGDDVTNGIFSDGLAYFQKTLWMLQAELGLAPEIDA